MQGLKENLPHIMLWELKQENNTMEMSRKLCSVPGQGVIIAWQVQNWFEKFCSGETSSEDDPRLGCSPNFDDEAIKLLVDSNPQKST